MDSVEALTRFRSPRPVPISVAFPYWQVSTEFDASVSSKRFQMTGASVLVPSLYAHADRVVWKDDASKGSLSAGQLLSDGRVFLRAGVLYYPKPHGRRHEAILFSPV